MAIYDNKPSKFEANSNGSYTYRWNIQDIEAPTGIGANDTDTQATTIKWQCDEVIVWATVTKDKLTETVITRLWDNDYEKKLINDYNAAKEGVFGNESSPQALDYITRYKTFLAQRKAIKEQIAADCAALNIL